MRTLEITTKIGCKNLCKYCPQDKLLGCYTDKVDELSFANFKKALNNVPKDVKIEFSGFSEAFFNKESSLMMKHAIQNRYHTELFTTLEGFTNNDLNVLKNVLFQIVWFHQYDGVDLKEFNEKIDLFKKT
jgi:hypothetical protein